MCPWGKTLVLSTFLSSGTTAQSNHFCLGKRPSLLHSRNTSFLMERNCCAQPNHFFPWEESSCSTQLFLFFFFFVLLMVTFALPVLITSPKKDGCTFHPASYFLSLVYGLAILGWCSVSSEPGYKFWWRLWQSSVVQDAGEEEEEDNASTASDTTGGPDFNYILNMALWSLTKERKDELVKQGEAKVRVRTLLKRSVPEKRREIGWCLPW